MSRRNPHQRRSKVWLDFKPRPPSVAGEEYMVECNRCGSMLKYNTKQCTTTQMQRHLETTACRVGSEARRRREEEERQPPHQQQQPPHQQIAVVAPAAAANNYSADFTLADAEALDAFLADSEWQSDI